MDRVFFQRRPLAGHARWRLVCFPYAGGHAATYASWPNRLPKDVELCPVQLAGRATRFSEPPATSIDAVVDEVVAALAKLPPARLALFGHSLGGRIAFELARRVGDSGAAPALLVVSAARAPDLPSRHAPVAHLPDDAFLEELREMGGTPEAILANEELMALMLPRIRGDFALSEGVVWRPGPPLDCPIIALAGRDDPWVNEEEAEGWRRQTSAAFELVWLPGGHFFIDDAPELVTEILARRLSAP